MNNKKIIATIAAGVAVAGALTFLFKSEKGATLLKKISNHKKNPAADIS